MKKISYFFLLSFIINLQAYNPEHLAKYKNGDTNLQNLDLSGALLQCANFENKNLSGTNLSDANLFFADLRNANLTNAKLTFAFVICANFSKANLTGANLTNIICAYTNFSNVIGLTREEEDLKQLGAIFNQKEWEKQIRLFTIKTNQKNEIKKCSCLKNILSRISCCCRKDLKNKKSE